MTAPFGIANALDAIPVVQSTLDRTTKYPNPIIGQRVENLQTGFVERWNGTTWLSPDPIFAVGSAGSGGGGGGSSTFPLAGQPGILGTGYLAIVDTTAHRNALNPAAFTVVLNLQTGNFEGWNGSQWETLLAGIGNFGTQPPANTAGSYATGRATVPWFNVSTFGATGNGTNDDTSAFQAAISAATALPSGGVVFVPPGKYLIAGQITWPAQNVSFYAIPNSAVIIPVASSVPSFVISGSTVNAFMYGLVFDATQGQSPSTTSCAIQSNGSVTGLLSIDRCSFKLTQAPGTGAVISLTGTNPGVTVSNSTIVNSNGAGFVTGGPVINCAISSTGGSALSAIAGSGQITGNTLTTCASGSAALVSGAAGTIITDNTFNSCSGSPLVSAFAGASQVTQNTFNSCTASLGISAIGEIALNTFSTFGGGTPVNIQGSNTTVSGNTFQSISGGHAITAGAVSLLADVTITGNVVNTVTGVSTPLNAVNLSLPTALRNITITGNSWDNIDGSAIYGSVNVLGLTITGNTSRNCNKRNNSLPTTGANAVYEVNGSGVTITGNAHVCDTADFIGTMVLLNTASVGVTVVGNTATVLSASTTHLDTLVAWGSEGTVVFPASANVELAANLWVSQAGPAAPANNGFQSGTGASAQVFVGKSVTITSSTNYGASYALNQAGAQNGGTALQTPQTIRVNATSGNVTVTLPTAATNVGAIVYIKRVDSSSNTVTVSPQTTPADTIDGSTSSKTIGALGVLRLQSSGPASGAANWDTL